MTKRVIKTGIGSYVDARGVPTYGFQGDEVDVHPDNVKRFDELNVQPGGDEEHVPPRVEQSMISPAAGAATSGTGSGLNTVVTEDDAKSEEKPKPHPRKATGR